jgi:hypothetical protein
LGSAFLEKTATAAAPTRATMASAPEGNSGADVEVVVLELLEELLAVLELLVVLLLVLEVVLELELELELEDDVEVELGEYVNVTALEAMAPLPPQVALTVNVPLVHAAFPPGCEV